MNIKLPPDTVFSIGTDVLYVRKGPEKATLFSRDNLSQQFEIEREYIVLWNFIDGRSTLSRIVKRIQKKNKLISDSHKDKIYEIFVVFMKHGLIRIVK